MAFAKSEQSYHLTSMDAEAAAVRWLLPLHREGHICWTTFLFDLAPSSIDKLLGFLWALIVLPWLQIYSCFVMKGTL